MNTEKMIVLVYAHVIPGTKSQKRIVIEIEDAPLSNKPRSVESPDSVKYCKQMSEYDQEEDNTTYEWQEYDQYHILQLLRQRNRQTSLSGDDEPSQEGAKHSVHPNNVREKCRAKGRS